LTFDQFDLHDDLLAGVEAMNYRQATPVQELAIPKIIDGKDLIACAQTGTGKTAAYLLPLLDRISHNRHDHTTALVLVPTRELAKQIDEQVEGFGYFVQANSIAIYGGGKGDDWDKQRKALMTGADIIVATPGRLIALLQLGQVDFSKLEVLVLDEADKMLDMGFSEDILHIVAQIPQKRQTLLFSATMPNKIREFAKRILNEPEEIRLAVSKPAEKIDQQFYLAYDAQKLPVLAHIIKTQDVRSMVLFTSRKSSVGPIVRELNKLGYEAKGVSSDIEQDEREQVLRGFKNKQFPILVATDVLSRGIDIDNLSHVVNFDSPRDAEDYVHRIGRTARADTTGTAITFVSDEDQDRIVKIEKLLEREFEKRAITEEIGLGSAPEFDPRRFSGLRHKRGGPRSAGSGGGRSGGANGGGRFGSGRDNARPGDRPRQPRPDPVRRSDSPTDTNPTDAVEGRRPGVRRRGEPVPVSDQPVSELPTSDQLTENQMDSSPEAIVLLPDGTPAPKRKKKRKPRPEGQADRPQTGESTPADKVDPNIDTIDTGQPETKPSQAVTTDAATGQPGDGTAPPKRKKRNKRRKPRPAAEGETIGNDESDADESDDSMPVIDADEDLGPVGSLSQRFLDGEL
jgi:ATP-dependent RNA helicase RhlE